MIWSNYTSSRQTYTKESKWTYHRNTTHLCLLWCHALQPSLRISTDVNQEMNDKENVLSSQKWMKLYLPFAENWIELKITMLSTITHLVSLSSAQPISTGKKKNAMIEGVAISIVMIGGFCGFCQLRLATLERNKLGIPVALSAESCRPARVINGFTRGLSGGRKQWIVI